MDDELFKQKLSEVADWRLPDTPRETSLNAKKRRGRKSAEEKYQEAHEETFLEMFEGVNPTYAPMLVKVKVQAVTCEDCGDHCANGRQVELKYYATKDKPHWRRKCVTCKHWENPVTKQFDIDNGTDSSIIWTDFLRDSKGAYKTKKNQAREQMSKDKESTGVIRSYPDTLNPI